MAFLRFGIVMALLALGSVAFAHGFVFLINVLFVNPDHEHVICFYDHQTGEKFFLQGDVRIKLDESVYWGQPIPVCTICARIMQSWLSQQASILIKH